MLGDIQKIDLRLSTWDEATSRPYKGEYNWTKKVLVNYQSPERPPYYFKWQNMKAMYMSKERAEMGYEPVIAPTRPDQKDPIKDGFDPYFPEGSEITTEGKYQYGDVIWCRCPLKKELERLERIDKISRGASQARIDKFEDALDKEGAKVPQEMIDRLRGNV